jgi:hypothetical protein
MSMYSVVESAYLLDDTETAAAAYDLLLPYAHLPMTASLGIACFGSVRHALGMASLTTGDADRAVTHLRGAVHDNLVLGHWPAAVLSRARLAQALVLRSERGDAAEAQRELDIALHDAARLGTALPSDGRYSAAVSGGSEQRLVVCRRDGRQWGLALGHRTTLVEESRGMQYLAVLLANPGHEIAAMDLAAGPGLLMGVAAGAADGVAQPMLDEVAVRAYRLRLSQLQAEIDEFEKGNDLGRAARVRAEREWLIAGLTSATGLGGRVRHFANGEERARISVGKAIRRAVNRIAALEPVIGAELQATVQTGRRCCYRPR